MEYTKQDEILIEQKWQELQEACRKANPILLEPMMKVSVIVPDEYLGNVIGDLNSRRGQIQGQESRPGATQIDALVPLANMFGYATDLRSMTQARGSFVMNFERYEEVPANIAKALGAHTFAEVYDGQKYSSSMDDLIKGWISEIVPPPTEKTQGKAK